MNSSNPQGPSSAVDATTSSPGSVPKMAATAVTDDGDFWGLDREGFYWAEAGAQWTPCNESDVPWAVRDALTAKAWASKWTPEHEAFLRDPERHADDLRPWTDLTIAGLVQNTAAGPTRTPAGALVLAAIDSKATTAPSWPAGWRIAGPGDTGDDQMIAAVGPNHASVKVDTGGRLTSVASSDGYGHDTVPAPLEIVRCLLWRLDHQDPRGCTRHG